MEPTKPVAPAEKGPLLEELQLLQEALNADHSGGACLPLRSYWDLRTAIMDAKRFLKVRKGPRTKSKRG